MSQFCRSASIIINPINKDDNYEEVIIMSLSKDKTIELKCEMINDESIRKGIKAEADAFRKQNKIYQDEMKKLINVKEFTGGDPLSEITRSGNEMGHFMIYAIGHGLTTEEIIHFHKEAGKEEMSERAQQIRDKLVGMSETFIADLKSKKDIKERAEYVENMYADFLIAMEKEGKKMALVMANGTNEELNALASSLASVQMSAMHQTFKLQGTPSDTQIDTLIGIDDRLKKAGKNYNFDDVASFLNPISTWYERFPNETDISMVCGEEHVNLNEFRDENSMFNSYIECRKMVRQLAKDRFDREAKNENIAFLSDKGIDAKAKVSQYLEDFTSRSFDKIDYTKEEAASHLSFGINIDVKSLSESMKSNRRRNVFGKEVDNSSKYNKIADLLTDIAEAKENNPEADLTKKYEELKKACKNYTDSRNPSSDDGKKRYGYVLLADAVANNGLCKFNEEKTEYAKAPDEKIQTVAQVFDLSNHYKEVMKARTIQEWEVVDVNELREEEDKENGIVRKDDKLEVKHNKDANKETNKNMGKDGF